MRLALLVSLASLLPALLGTGATGALSAATPVPATSGVTCQAPPASPTPIPSPTPEPPLGVGPTPTPAPDPEATVDPLLAPQVATAAALLEACWNSGAWDAVTRVVAPRFLESAFGISGKDDRARARALAALDLGPLRIEAVGPVTIWSDGRGAVDVHYRMGRGRPVQAVAARWFLRAGRGVARFDEQRLLPAPPLGDRVTVGFAITGGDQPLRWASPAGTRIPASPVIALHGANRGHTPHTVILQNGSGQTLGLLTLPAQQQGDLLLLDLPPGAYHLRAATLPGPPLDVWVMGS